MVSRYIEIDSSYRDRNLWPNISEFEVLISQSGRREQNNAFDPVSEATPIVTWSPNEFIINNTGSTTFNVTITNITVNSDNTRTILFSVNNGTDLLQTKTNYYTGSHVRLTTGGNLERYRIISYEFISNQTNNIGKITVNGLVNATIGNGITISSDVTLNDESNLTINPYSFLFVPNGRSGHNAYVNCIIYNHDKKTYRQIIDYDSISKLIKFERVAGWLHTDFYSIRKTPPISGQNITTTNFSVFSLNDLATFSNTQMFKNSFLSLKSVTKPITWHSRLITRYETLTGNVTATNSTTEVFFPEHALSDDDDYYKDAFIILNPNQPLLRTTHQITSYNATTKLATFLPAFAGTTAGTLIPFTFRSIFVNKSFDNTIDLTHFEILPFSYDNYNPFVYSGTIQQEMVCYEIELLNLIIPNKILNCGYGNRIAFYPYIYVEISNVHSRAKNAIYSNNFNAAKVTFRVPITDVQNPMNTSFLNFDGDRMIQTIKFNPHDNLFLSVRLSNGELFKTAETELFSPSSPNPEIQISACFKLKKI